MRVVNRTRGIVLGEEVRTAETFLSRLVGLLGTAAIAEGEGLWIVPCRSVHTLGMRYPIDVAFLDARGSWSGSWRGFPRTGSAASFGMRGGRWSCARGSSPPPAPCPATGWSSKRGDRLDTTGRRLLHCVLALSLPEC